MADIDDIVQRFAVHLETNEGLSTQTVFKYQRYLERLAAFAGKDGRSLLTIDGEELQNFAGTELHAQGISPLSRKVAIAAFRKFYAWLHKHGVGADIGKQLRYPKAGRKMATKMELHYMQKLIMAPGLNTLKGVRDTAMILVLGGCGCRPSGVLKLNESDLIFVNEEGKEELYIKFREKGENERYVPAPDEVRVMLRAYLGHPDLEKIDRHLPDGDKVLFVSLKNKKVPAHEYYGENRRLGHKALNKLFEYYGRRAGIPKNMCHPKALRHTFGTEMAEDDVHPKISASLMGHKDLKSQDPYIHLASRKLRQVIKKSNPLAKITIPVISDLAKTT